MLADLTMIATLPVDEVGGVSEGSRKRVRCRPNSLRHLTRRRACPRRPNSRSCRPTIRIARTSIASRASIRRQPNPPVQAPSEKPGITEPPRPRA